MSSYTIIKDPKGAVQGIWFKDSASVNDRKLIFMLLSKSGASSMVIEDAIAGCYRIVTNTKDPAGGCYVMLGDMRAPGE